MTVTYAEADARACLEFFEAIWNENGDDDLHHYYCEVCYPEGENAIFALCGKNIAEEPEVLLSDDDLVCVVCDELADLRCERCGC